jgi:hypothetical protein
VTGGCVGGGGKGAEDRSGGATGERKEGGFGDELGSDVGGCGAEGAAESDFATSFQNGDDHEVVDPDPGEE